MPAPKGNQFAKDNKGGGRKGFELEAKQYKKMLKMTDLYFKLFEKILKGKPTTEERMRFEDVRQAMGKIIDKLHATKQEGNIDLTTAGKPLPKPYLEIKLHKNAIRVDDSDQQNSEAEQKD